MRIRRRMVATIVFRRTRRHPFALRLQAFAAREASTRRVRINFIFGVRAIGLALAIPQSLSGQKRNYLERNVETKPDRTINPVSTPEPPRPVPPVPRSEPASGPAAAPAGDQATISKGLFVKGEISGTESLYIDGKVEGSISLPGNRVTIGRNGTVGANVTAREVVVMGKVRGNVSAYGPRGHPCRRRAERRCCRGAHQHRGWRVLQGRNRYPQARCQAGAGPCRSDSEPDTDGDRAGVAEARAVSVVAHEIAHESAFAGQRRFCVFTDK